MNLVRARSWGRVKPPIGAQIDWGHPLARGLQFCAIVGNRSELVRGGLANPLNYSLGGFGPTPLGDGIIQGNVGQSFMGYPYPAGLALNNAYTFVVFAQPTGWTSNSTLLCQPFTTVTTSPYTMINLGRDNATSSLNTAYVNGSTRYLVASDAGAIALGDPFGMYAATRQGDTATFYRDGRQHGAQKSLGGDFPVTFSAQPIAIMGFSATSNENAVQGPCAAALIWDRALQPSEMAWLQAEPYAFIAPPGPKILYVDLAAAPVAVADPTTLIVARSPSLRAPYGLSRPGRPAFSMLGDTTLITTAAISDTETGSGTDAGESLAAALTDAETGSGVDAGEALAVALTAAETGLAVDAGESITVAISDSDTATALDAESSISLTDPDTGTAVDTGAIAAALADPETGSALDAGEALAAALSATETGTAVDAGESLAATLTDAETGTAADTESLNTGASTTPTDTESGTGTESGAIAAALTDPDTGAALDAGEALVVSISDSDTASALDAEALAVTITDDDLMVFLESEAIAAALTDVDSGSADEDGSIVETIIVDAILPACVTLTVTDLGSVVLTVGDVPDGVELTVSDPWAVALTVGEC